tara:strand:- start:2538 stop:2873 length:336 start_codon:yes stop_codon:yes gene_type:complete
MTDFTYTNIWGFQGENSVARNRIDPDKDLITEIHWSLTVTSSDNLSAYTYGVESFEKGETVIPFKDLTKKNLISWVKNKLGSTRVVDLEVLLKNNIIEQRNPTSVYGLPSS